MSSLPGIYLDYAATTPIAPEVLDAMAPYLSAEQYGNPSSIHRFGKQARKALETARDSVKQSLHAKASDEIVFTGSGTESDNLGVIGTLNALAEDASFIKRRHVITSGIEHAAVAKQFDYLARQGWEITRLPVDAEGFVSLESLKTALRPETAMLSIMHANNEIGSIQPLSDISDLLRPKGILLHTDAIQTVGKIPLDVQALGVDYLSLSAHKFYGPKGMGALYIRQGAPKPLSLVWGGGQEGNYRSGTQNVAGCVGLAKALELACAHLESEIPRLHQLQRSFIHQLQTRVPSADLNGPFDLARRVPGHLNFSFPPGDGEGLVLQLDLKGIAASTGSACKSASLDPSPIVLALGKSVEAAQATVRFSMGRQTTQDDVDRTVEVLTAIMSRYGSVR